MSDMLLKVSTIAGEDANRKRFSYTCSNETLQKNVDVVATDVGANATSGTYTPGRPNDSLALDLPSRSYRALVVATAIGVQQEVVTNSPNVSQFKVFL